VWDDASVQNRVEQERARGKYRRREINCREREENARR
jgi:hypothetical protein